MRRALVLTVLLAALLAPSASAQESAVVTETLKVPTVDGAYVSVEVRRPEGQKVPVILTYSP